MAALDKIFDLLDEQPDLVDAPDAIELPPIRGELRFDHVSFRYGGRARTTPTGRSVGAARHRPRRSRRARRWRWSARPAPASRRSRSSWRASTTRPRARAGRRARPAVGDGALAALADGDRPAGGVPVQRHGPREHRLRAPVGAPTRRSRPRPARSAPTTFIAALEHGYDTQVGERGVQLSAGQRQLLAFARALVADPRILVLDEATSNVDVHTETLIEQGLRRLLAGRTAIVIAHRLSTIRRAGRIVVLEHGQIVEQGTHEELLEAAGSLLAPVPRLGRAGGSLSVHGVRGAARPRVDHAGQGHAAARGRARSTSGATGVRENRRFFLIDDRDRMVNAKRSASSAIVAGLLRRSGRRCGSSSPTAASWTAGSPGRDRSTPSSTRTRRPRSSSTGPGRSALSELAGQPLRLVEAVDGGAVDRGAARRGVADLPGVARAAGGGRAGCDGIDARRFRMLIEIDGVDAHAEDRWVGRSVADRRGRRRASTATSAAA